MTIEGRHLYLLSVGYVPRYEETRHGYLQYTTDEEDVLDTVQCGAEQRVVRETVLPSLTLILGKIIRVMC